MGRVGRLAVALGIGAAFSTGIACATASADSTGPSTASSGTSPSSAKQSSNSSVASPDAGAAGAGNGHTGSDAPTSRDAAIPGAASAQDFATPGGSRPLSTATATSQVSDEAEQSHLHVNVGSTFSPDKTVKSGSAGVSPRQSSIQRPTAFAASAPSMTTKGDADDDADPQQRGEWRGADAYETGRESESAEVNPRQAKPLSLLAPVGSLLAPVGEDAVAATLTQPQTATSTAPSAAAVASSGLSFLSMSVNSVLQPTSDPNIPASAPAVWTLAAAARRELSVTQPAPETTTSQPTMPEAAAPGSAVPQTFTGQPSFITQIAALALGVVTPIMKAFGLDFATIASVIATDSPPFFTTLGLRVERDEFEGMPVWTITPPSPSGRYVAAIHGGAYVIQPTVIHWLDYAAVARSTGATVVVPIYTLAPQSTASVEVPRMADFLTSLIDQHGAESVTVYADSAGGGLALAAAQELVRRGSATPASMVLLSPWLDVSMTNPAIASVRDPILSAAALKRQGTMWAGDLDPTDPMVSPVYGSLEGLAAGACLLWQLRFPIPRCARTAGQSTRYPRLAIHFHIAERPDSRLGTTPLTRGIVSAPTDTRRIDRKLRLGVGRFFPSALTFTWTRMSTVSSLSRNGRVSRVSKVRVGVATAGRSLRLQDRVRAEDIPDVTFRVREGLIHDRVIFAFLPDTQAERRSL